MDLVSELIRSDGNEKAKIEKRLALVSQRLITLRKQHMSITKVVCDLELKKTALAKDLIDIATVHDVFVKLSMRFAQYVRHFADDGIAPKEVRQAYYAITNVIAGELHKMVKDLISELRSPTKDPRP